MSESADNVAHLPVRDEAGLSRKISVQVGYGPNNQEFEIDRGNTVQDILKDGFIQEIIGFSGGSNETVVVNGDTVGRDHVMRPGDRLEVIKRAGEKA